MSPHSPEEPLVVWWVLPGTDVWEGRLVRNPPSSPSPSEWLKQRLHLLVLVFCITLLITQKLRMGLKEFFCLEKAISCHSLTPRHSQTYFLRRGIFSKKTKTKRISGFKLAPTQTAYFSVPDVCWPVCRHGTARYHGGTESGISGNMSAQPHQALSVRALHFS